MWLRTVCGYLRATLVHIRLLGLPPFGRGSRQAKNKHSIFKRHISLELSFWYFDFSRKKSQHHLLTSILDIDIWYIMYLPFFHASPFAEGCLHAILSELLKHKLLSLFWWFPVFVGGHQPCLLHEMSLSDIRPAAPISHLTVQVKTVVSDGIESDGRTAARFEGNF